MKKLFILLSFFIQLNFAFSQTTLSENDIAFLGYATDAPDRFAFILLKDVDGATTITFTDNAWSGSAFCTNENNATWTSGSSLGAGTVITITDPGSGSTSNVSGGGTCAGRLSGLAAAGDQIIAYQGTNYLAAVSSAGFLGTCNGCGVNNNATCLPGGLANVVSFSSDLDNGYYNGILTGTPEEIRAAINDPANWVRDDNNQTWPSWSFTLPIQLIDFSVEAKFVNTFLLTWQTALEINNSHFEIERSADGRTFSKIGEVKGAGNSQVLQPYRFTDENPVAGINYYRLKQVDFDGAFTYSPVRSIRFGKSNDVVITPQPVSDVLQVELIEALSNDANWQIIDFAGRIVANGTVAAETLRFTADMNTLPHGNYVLRVANNEVAVVKQFQKK
jgi:Secretion system C-terminal sorting domain